MALKHLHNRLQYATVLQYFYAAFFVTVVLDCIHHLLSLYRKCVPPTCVSQKKVSLTGLDDTKVYK